MQATSSGIPGTATYHTMRVLRSCAGLNAPHETASKPGRIFFWPGFKKTQAHRFGGSLDITLEGGDRRAFNEQRRDYEGLARGGYGGRVETVMGLGTPAFRYSREPSSNEWELYVFHPRLSRQNNDPATKRPMPPAGSFAILPDPSVSGSMPFASHVALARAVLKFPKR